VLAAISEETWRLSVFKTHGFIYEMSASKITAIPLEEYLEYKSKNKKHHPDRKIGKVAELASGFGGSIGAWKRFKADEFLTDEQIMQAVSAWRKASPGIVKLWYGLEKAAKDSILNPQTVYSYGAIKYFTSNDILHCILPSSRFITYHRPRIIDNAITFEGYNSNENNGARGWMRIDTYGGKLTENCVQAIARDILANAIVNLENVGYEVVMHIHDEIVAEIPEKWGSIQEFEEIMSTLPIWAHGWPLKASGGWRGKRYTK